MRKVLFSVTATMAALTGLSMVPIQAAVASSTTDPAASAKISAPPKAPEPPAPITKRSSLESGKPKNSGMALDEAGRLVPADQVATDNRAYELTISNGHGLPKTNAKPSTIASSRQVPANLRQPKGLQQTWLLDRPNLTKLRAQRNAQARARAPKKGPASTSFLAAPPPGSTGSPTNLSSSARSANVLAAPQIAPTTVTNGTISGTVTDASTAAGLSGVTVNAYSASAIGPYTTTTGSGGTYSLSVAPGTYVVDFEDHTGGHLIQWWDDQPNQQSANPVVVTSGATTGSINAALIPGGSIAGTITNSSAQPLAGICASVYSAADDEFVNAGACTDSTGHYQTTGVPAGSYTIQFTDSAGQYVSQWWNAKPGQIEANAVTVTVGATTSASPVMSLGGTISGTITNASTHATLANVCVTATGHYGAGGPASSFCSSSTGAYTVTGLTSGSYTVQFSDQSGTGYLPQFYAGAPGVNESTPVSVTQGSPTANINAALILGGTISGTVTDASTHAAIAGVCVSVYGSAANGNACTNASGVYNITGLATATDYRVAFYDQSSGQGYLPYNDPNTESATDGTTTTVNATMILGGRVSGTVTNSSSTPLAGICAQVSNQSAQFYGACTDSSGSFSVVGVPTGSYTVYLYDSNNLYLSKTLSGTIAVTDGTTTPTGTTVLALGGSVTGTITDASTHSPVANVCVAYGIGCSNASGVYTVTGLGTGTYSFTTTDSSGAYLPGSLNNVSVTQGSTTSNENIAVQLGGVISGTVTDSVTGQPLPDACVQAWQGTGSTTICDGSPQQVTSDSTGAFSIRGLATGTYTLQVFDESGFYLSQWYNGQATQTNATGVSVTAGSTTSSITVAMVRGGIITGTITDAATHQPLGAICASINTSNLFAPPITGCSDPTGAYELVGLSTATDYQVTFQDAARLYMTQTTGNLSVTQGTTTSGINAAMVLGGQITGTVTDATTHNPVPNVCVNAADSGSDAGGACTDTVGNYDIVGLATSTTYQVQFEQTGPYLSQWYNGQTSQSTATSVSVTAGSTTSSISAALVVGAKITGTVTDSTTHNPLPGTCATATDPAGDTGTACSDSNGNYTIEGLPTATNYTVKFAGPYYNPCGFFACNPLPLYVTQWWNDQPSASSANPVSATIGAATSGIDAAMVPLGKISGTVTDAGTSNPIGACVSASDTAGDNGSACTDSSGNYTIIGLPTATNYTVSFTAPGYVNQWWNNQPSASMATSVSVTDGTTTTGINAAMVVGGTISGTVTDVGTGNPIPGAPVSVFEGTNQVGTTTTASDGTYSIAGLPAATDDTVEFQGPNSGIQYLTQWWNDQSDQAHANPVTVTLGNTTGGINAALSPGGSISGTVTDTETGSPLAGICVNIFSPSDLNSSVSSACTDANGHYTAYGLVTSSYAVEFIDSNHTYVTQWYNNKPSGTAADLVSVTLNQDTPNINAALAVGGTISGTVTDAKTGSPAPTPCVQVSDASTGNFVMAACGDSNGNYQVGGLPTGSYDVYFNGTGTLVGQSYTNGAVAVTLGANTPNIDAALLEGGTITGTVFDPSGNPLGAACSIDVFQAGTLNSLGDTCTSFDSFGSGTYFLGAFDGGALPPGNYQVEFNLLGYATQWYNGAANQASAASIAVTAGAQTTGIDAHLVAGGTITGTITTGSGATPVTNACVFAYASDSGHQGSTCSEDSSGNYTLSLPADTYTVQFYGSNYISQNYSTPVTVTVGGTTTGIDADLAVGATMSGTVTDSSSHALLQGVCVQFTDTSTGNSYGGDFPYCTDTSGSYTSPGLPTGSYDVQFTDFDGRYLTEYYNGATDSTQATPVSVTAPNTTTGIDAALTLGAAVSGKVTAASNDGALPDICITLYPTSPVGAPGLSEGCTDSNGHYQTFNVAAGSYDVEFTDPNSDYATQWYNGATNQTGATAVTLTAGETATSIDAALTSSVAVLSGTVTDAVTTNPINGACVYLYPAGTITAASYATCTDSAGNYIVGHIAPGSYNIAFFDPAGDHITQWYNNQPTQSTAASVSLVAGQTDSTVNAALAEITAISGTVTDAVTSAPLPNVCVYLYSASNGQRNSVPGACTDSSGNYVLAAPAGSYKVAFLDNASSHLTQWANGASSESTAATITVVNGATTTGVNAAITEVTGVAGTVTDSTTGAPVADICVYPYTTAGVRTSDTGTCTDSSGTYILPLGANSYDLAFYDPQGRYLTQWANGQSSQSAANPVTVTANQTTTADAQIVGLAAVTGTVTQSTNGDAAYPGVCVYLDNAPSGSSTGSYSGLGGCTDSAGRFTISGVPPGPYKLGYYTPSTPQGPSAPPTPFWYNGQSSESNATVVTVDPDQTTNLVNQSLP